MVYTVTLNPALDYVMQVEKLRYDDINRSFFEDLHYGGKGINVSVILTRLGVHNKALGFIAGFTGDWLEKMLQDEGVLCDFLRLSNGDTRINVKIKSDSELDINARGPQISDENISRLISAMQDIKRGDYLVLSGSVPESAPADAYQKIFSSFYGKGINLVVDATGQSLTDALKYNPFLIKPNHHELGDLFGVKIESEKDAVFYAQRLQKAGAENVLVSLGGKGAVLLDKNGDVTRVGTVQGKIVNTVGSGDSMVAGFIAGYEQKKDFKYALKLGAACGNATAFCESLAQPDDIKTAFDKLSIYT